MNSLIIMKQLFLRYTGYFRITVALQHTLSETTQLLLRVLEIVEPAGIAVNSIVRTIQESQRCPALCRWQHNLDEVSVSTAARSRFAADSIVLL
ncbi:MAG: hypothetical protein IPK52_15385 [Chloroflexi bacterium]|nr:hypothetical protein [Chloroflexota bacterium]